MKRLERIERHGYKVQVSMNTGNVIATKRGRTIRTTSITQLHKIIFNY